MKNAVLCIALSICMTMTALYLVSPLSPTHGFTALPLTTGVVSDPTQLGVALASTCDDDSNSLDSGLQVEKKSVSNPTSCSECLTLTLVVPKNCHVNIDLLASEIQKLFEKPIFRDVCAGCPLERTT